jgi:type II secretory pathway pseudopilin PulG
MRRGAFTLLEALVVCLVAVAVLGSILTFMFHAQSWSGRASDQALAVSELRLALARMSREVREARQVLYPAAGHRPQDGLGLVNSKGEAVFYRLVKVKDAPPATPFDLVRDPVGGTREVVAARVTRMSVAIADPGRGREPSLVRMLLTRATGLDPAGDSGVSPVTSASARAVLTRCLAIRGEEL